MSLFSLPRQYLHSVGLAVTVPAGTSEQIDVSIERHWSHINPRKLVTEQSVTNKFVLTDLSVLGDCIRLQVTNCTNIRQRFEGRLVFSCWHEQGPEEWPFRG